MSTPRGRECDEFNLCARCGGTKMMRRVFEFENINSQKQISTLLMILIGTYSIDHVQSTVLQPQFVAIFPS